MPVSSLWIFARLSLCDTPWVSKNVGALVGPSGRPGNRSHKPRAGQSVNYSVGHVEPLSLLPTLLGFPMIWSKDHPFRCFQQPYIAPSAGREIFGRSYRSRGFARSAPAGLGRQGVILSPYSPSSLSWPICAAGTEVVTATRTGCDDPEKVR